jgi:hypothetical protein
MRTCRRWCAAAPGPASTTGGTCESRRGGCSAPRRSTPREEQGPAPTTVLLGRRGCDFHCRARDRLRRLRDPGWQGSAVAPRVFHVSGFCRAEDLWRMVSLRWDGFGCLESASGMLLEIDCSMLLQTCGRTHQISFMHAIHATKLILRSSRCCEFGASVRILAVRDVGRHG